MKKFISFLSLFLLISFSAKSQWITSFENAQKIAAATNKLLLVDFWATWCGPCKAMDRDTWSKPEIKKIMQNYVPVKIDIDTDRVTSRKYSIRSIPDIYIMDANGEVLYKSKGYKDKNKMLQILKKYAVSTQYLKNELLVFFKDKTGDNALAIAEKYLDFSIYLDKSIKVKFFTLSSAYIYKAKKLYKKEGKKNKNKQRVTLLESYKYLLKGKYDKAIKKLDAEIKEEKVKEKNRKLYDFIYFTTYNKLKDKEMAKKWYEKLKRHSNFQKLFLKSRKI